LTIIVNGQSDGRVQEKRKSYDHFAGCCWIRI